MRSAGGTRLSISSFHCHKIILVIDTLQSCYRLKLKCDKKASTNRNYQDPDELLIVLTLGLSVADTVLVMPAPRLPGYLSEG